MTLVYFGKCIKPTSISYHALEYSDMLHVYFHQFMNVDSNQGFDAGTTLEF